MTKPDPWQADIDRIFGELAAILEANDGVDVRARIFAVAQCAGVVLASVDCPECRRLTREYIDDTMKLSLDYMMEMRAQQPQTSDHVH